METSTPMLKQYHSLKSQHQHCILFFRLGDFYEMFYDDAKIASRELDLVLTARGKGTAHKVPMCGFPHHAAENYIPRLIAAGHKVAICEQVEDPGEAKGIVKRDITRIITSGTYIDEKSDKAKFSIALFADKKHIGYAFCNSIDGTIHTNRIEHNDHKVAELLGKIQAIECIYPESQKNIIEQFFKHPFLSSKKITLSPFEDWAFNPDIAQKTLKNHYGVHNLHGFAIETLPESISCCGALLEYLKQMNKQPMKHMDKIRIHSSADVVYISPPAHRGLEIDQLIRTIDYTNTAVGRRLFNHWVYHPLMNVSRIESRQQAIGLLLKNTPVCSVIKDTLKTFPDIEKNLSRLSCGYTHAKDFVALEQVLSKIPDLKQHLKSLIEQNTLFTLDDLTDLRTQLTATIDENVPLSKPEGKLIKPGYHQELDDLRRIQQNGRDWLKKVQEEEIKRTGISSLKIGFNKVFGYYIEITKTHTKSVPADYIRKQTLVNAERYITPELKEYEEKILTAQDKIISIEKGVIDELQGIILSKSKEIHRLCEQIAIIDCLFSLSMLAQTPQYHCPKITNNDIIDIKDGRHPVVEMNSIDTFIANDTFLDQNNSHLIILTGPNMAGKSTYIRQTAILVILAQIGSYIPAQEATIGIVDKIFTRIGAHDDISQGQSTFMVEMNETADILNNLTERSLVILDEIGRGTSTFDGLSLAWALAEHFHQTKARTLFATHFHELTALAGSRSGIQNHNVAVKKWEDEIIFLHKIIPGSSDDSYGIYVAKLAGIPKAVIARSQQILTQLELKNNIKENLSSEDFNEEQLTLFQSGKDPITEALKEKISAIDINQLTPLQAMNLLQELKNTLD